MNRAELYKALGVKGQAALERANVLEALPEGVQRVFDPAMWLAFISGIVEVIRGCRNPETAKSNIREGSSASYLAAKKVARDEGYRGKELKRVAYELVQEGKNLSDDELDGLVNDANDVPQPPPATGGFWPMWVMILILFPSTLMAQDTKFWPIDEEQNKRLDDHDNVIKEIRKELDAIYDDLSLLQKSPGTKLTQPAKVEPLVQPSKTAVCKCQGSNRGVCYCLQKGLQCKCNASTGSIWNVDANGRAISKTGQYTNPQQAQTVAPAPIVARKVVVNNPRPIVQALVQPVIQVPQYTHSYQCTGRSCRRMKIRN